MTEPAEGSKPTHVGKYLRAVLRPGQVVVEVGGPNPISEELARDAGVRIIRGDAAGLGDEASHTVPRLVWIAEALDPEQVLSKARHTLELHCPLVMTGAEPRGGLPGLLEAAVPLGYRVALRSSDSAFVLLVHERDVIDALEARAEAGEASSDEDVLSARLAQQTQQLRRLEAEVFSLKHRLEREALNGTRPSAQQPGPEAPRRKRSRDFGTLRRKYRKLVANPDRFFEDSRSPLVRNVLGRFYSTMAGRRGRLR